MELIIQEFNPSRWEKHLLRRREDNEDEGGAARPERESVPEPSGAADGDEDAVYSEGEPEEPDLEGQENLFGYGGPHGPGSASALTGHEQEREDRTTGAATGPVGRESDSGSLIQRLFSRRVRGVLASQSRKRGDEVRHDTR